MLRDWVSAAFLTFLTGLLEGALTVDLTFVLAVGIFVGDLAGLACLASIRGLPLVGDCLGSFDASLAVGVVLPVFLIALLWGSLATFLGDSAFLGDA